MGKRDQDTAREGRGRDWRREQKEKDRIKRVIKEKKKGFKDERIDSDLADR